MRLTSLMLIVVSSSVYAQLTFEAAQKVVQPYRLGYADHLEKFMGKSGYGAPLILTSDGGAAIFGDNMLYKFDKTGKEQWKKPVKIQFDEMECQGVAQDVKGNLYIFMLSYDHNRYRGGSERVLCFDKTGKLLWDKTLGNYTVMDNPNIAYIKAMKDGKIYMRGHVVKDTPEPDKDPVYRYWEGWLDSTGKFTQKAGEKIEWEKGEWQKRFAPDEQIN